MAFNYVLGLDLGTSSVGWAVLEVDKFGNPIGIDKVGVRLFNAGMDNMENGKGDTPSAERRSARQDRRQIDRRKRRKNKIFKYLQAHDLLPGGDLEEVISTIDNQLLKNALQDNPEKESNLPHLLPYYLRTKALDYPLSKFELGRALHHLSQRRGFASNRLAERGENDGEVRKGISHLYQEMEKTKSRTLGEFFSSINPHHQRIRQRWTSRKMYEEEYAFICSMQKQHHPDILTEDFIETLHKLIFFQRPLKSSSHLIGKCQLEENRKRAPWALPSSQKFRMLTQLANIRIIERSGKIRLLSKNEWEILNEQLNANGTLSISKAKRTIGIKNSDRLSLENGGENTLCGLKTDNSIRKIIGDKWDQMPLTNRDNLVREVIHYRKSDALNKRLVTYWGLTHDQSRQINKLHLEGGYCHYSSKAILKLLTHLEKFNGKPTDLTESIQKVYGSPEIHDPCDQIPPICNTLPQLKNPAVKRTLTEMRKVVNSLIKKFGKPQKIKVELARELRSGPKEREAVWKRNRSLQKKRKDAKLRILEEVEDQLGREPSRDDIEKVMLADECGWTCPFTGRSFGMRQLIGDDCSIHVEHIIPFSRSLDNSFANKTLCAAEENMHRKGNLTPYELYHSDEKKYEKILARVEHFKSNMADEKLRRFRLREIEDLGEFCASQLNDTRYVSKLAISLLGNLYGGSVDSSGQQRIFAVKGQITAYLRRVWKMNKLLSGSHYKIRDDHRHHAVDAIAIALASTKTTQLLSAAAQCATPGRRWLFGNMALPWRTFYDDCLAAISDCGISKRTTRKLKGQLHNDTNYGLVNINKEKYTVLRKPLEKLTAKEIGLFQGGKGKDESSIIDAKVRDAIREKLNILKTTSPEKAFKNRENHPILYRPDGSSVAIHKVRVKQNVTTTGVGKKQIRNVATANNHHLQIFEEKNKKGKILWKGRIVTLLEATNIFRSGKNPAKEAAGSPKIIFTLAVGDTLIADTEEEKILVVRSISKEKNGKINIEMSDILDARLIKDIKASKNWIKKTPGTLQKINAKKIQMTSLGEVRTAND